MKKLLLSAALTLIALSAESRCMVRGDAIACFPEPVTIAAYSNAEAATAAFRNVTAEPKWLIATNDPTRRMLVVYPCGSDCLTQQAVTDGYVSEFYFPSEAAEMASRWDAMSGDQQAGGLLIPVPSEVLGGGTLMIYRKFGCDDVRRSIDDAQVTINP